MGAEATRVVTGGSHALSTPSAANTSGALQFAKADAKAQRDARATGGQAQTEQTTGPSTAPAQTNTSRAVTGPRDQPDKRSNGEPSQGRVTITTQKANASEPAKTTPPQNMDAQSIDVQTAANRIAEAARAERGRLGSKARDPAIKSVLDTAEQFPTLVAELRKQRDATRLNDPSLPAWLRPQIQSGTLDAENLALMKAMGFDANNTANIARMSEPERRVLRSNALVSALLQRHKIRIREGSNLLPVVKVNGAAIQLTPEQYEVWRQVRDGGDLVAFALTLLPRDGRDGELQRLKAASSLLRLERTKSQVAELMHGDKRDDKAALQLLKASMDNANLTGEAKDIWEMVGKPYFDQAYVDARLREQVASPKGGWWGSLLAPGDSVLIRVGPWLQQLANEAPPEVVDMALTAVKRDFSPSWITGGRVAFLAGLIKGVEVVAEGTGVDRSQELAAWLTGSRAGGPLLSLADMSLSSTQIASGMTSTGLTVQMAVEEAGGNPSSPLLQALLKSVDSQDGYKQYREDLRSAVQEGVNKAAQKAYRENRSARYREFGAASLEPFFARFKNMPGIASARSFKTETERHNFLGQMMGLMPVNVQAARAQDHSQEWYPASSSEGLQVAWAESKVRLKGGANAQVRAIPTIYASKDEGDARQITLFEVVSGDGKTKTLIDCSEAAMLPMLIAAKDLMLGKRDINSDGFMELISGLTEGRWEYKDFKDFLNDNQLDREGTLHRLETRSGQLAVVGSAAAQWTGTRKAFYYVDIGASFAGLIASLALLAPSGGASGVGTGLAVGRLAALGFTVWGALSSGRELWLMNMHGASLSLCNPEARAHWIGGVGGLVPGIGTVGSAVKASAALNAGNRAKAAVWGGMSKGIGLLDTGMGAFVMGDQTLELAKSFPHMSEGQRDQALKFYALAVAQMALPVTAQRIRKVWEGRVANGTHPGAGTLNPKGLPDDLAMSDVIRETFFRRGNGKPIRTNKKLTTNEHYRKFHESLTPEEKQRLPKPHKEVSVDQLTLALGKIPGGLEKVIQDIHAHPMGYIQRLDVSLENLEHKIKAGDSYTVSTEDGEFVIVTSDEIHLIAPDGSSSARWRVDDPDHIAGLPADADGKERHILVGADPGADAGDAARRLHELLLADARRVDPKANSQAQGVKEHLATLAPGGKLSQETLAERLKLTYAERKAVPLAFKDESGRHWALIPQLCCGGFPHYSNFDPSKLTARNRQRLDEIAQKEWLELYNNPDTREIAAKIDVGIIGLDFSAKAPDEHLDNLARKFPGVSWSVGEITAHKEMVSTQLGDERLKLKSDEFQDLLKKVDKSGHMLLLHNDGGGHGINTEGRPEAAKTDYVNIDEMIEALSGHSKVNVVIAHTFFGRFVRPDDKSRTDPVTIVKWNYENMEPIPSTTRTREITAPEHIHQMYKVAEKIPNARFDISWNDISQAFAHPHLRDHLIQFILDYPDRVLFGSDTVKPVNAGHYNQGLYTIMPVLAELARARRPDGDVALWMVLRGNYETLRTNAQRRVETYTKELLPQAGRDKKIRLLEERRKDLETKRTAMSVEAKKQFDAWVTQVRRLPSLGHDGGGVFENLYNILPRAKDMHWVSKGQRGPGTPGGHAHADESPKRKKAKVQSIKGVLVSAAAVTALTPLSGEAANSLAFLARGVLTACKAGFSKLQRLQIEDIFEQGRVNPEKLDQFVNRIIDAKDALGFDNRQLAKVLAATKQFKANYEHLDVRNLPLQTGETEDHRFLKIMAKAGEYQVTVDRILSGQASSITPLDPRRTEGFFFRAAQLATYLFNDAAFVHWLSQNGLDTSSPAAKLYSVFRVLFAAGNAVMTGTTAVSLIAGSAGVNWDSTKRMQRFNFAAQASITAGGGFWTAHDGLQAHTALSAGQSNVAAVAAIKTLLDAGFAYYAGKSTLHAGGATFGWRQKGPSEQEQAALLLGTFLVLRVLMGLATSDSSEPSAEERRDDKRSQAAPQR